GGNQLVIDVMIADAADKTVDSRLCQILRISEIEDFRDDFQVALMCFVDDGGVGLRFKLCTLSGAVIYQQFDRIDLLTGQIKDRPLFVSRGGNLDSGIRQCGRTSTLRSNASADCQ